MRIFFRCAGWSAVAFLLPAAYFSRSVYLISLREWIFWGGLGVGAAGMVWVAAELRAGRRRWENLAAAVLLAVAGLMVGGRRWAHEANVRAVAEAEPERLRRLGAHFLVGWRGREETTRLARAGAIGGIFVTRRNFPDWEAGRIAAEIAGLQATRREAGLGPLWVATDQEGGPVAKMSPPLESLPPLGEVAARALAEGGPEGERRAVRAYAEGQGKGLAELGVNLNFAPVADLRRSAEVAALDFDSQIPRRALARDAETVTRIAGIYAETLRECGVTATLKHFPGLGAAGADTHHFTAKLILPVAQLEREDWRPFREVAAATGAAVMLGHVMVPELDTEWPVSCSSKIIGGVLRGQWGMRNVLVTDDFCMTPIFHSRAGISGCAAVALEAGVDLILISYDGEAYYDAMAGLLRGPELRMNPAASPTER